jgi:hypothetical protein
LNPQNPDVHPEAEFSVEVLNLKRFRQHGRSYDEAIIRLMDLIANTECLMADADSTPSGIEGDFKAQKALCVKMGRARMWLIVKATRTIFFMLLDWRSRIDGS